MDNQTTIDAVAECIGRLVRPEHRRPGMAVIVKGAAREVLDIVKRQYVEQAVAGAVMGYLPLLETCSSAIDCDECGGDWKLCDPPAIPTASVGPFVGLAGDVARGMLKLAPCTWRRDGDCLSDVCDDDCRNYPDQVPFAAAYAEVSVKGVWWREYVLVSRACYKCDGTCLQGTPGVDQGPCGACGGTGASVNMKTVAARYSNGPEAAGNTPREARFRARAG